MTRRRSSRTCGRSSAGERAVRDERYAMSGTQGALHGEPPALTWTEPHPNDMETHMKTTLVIPDAVLDKLRHEAAHDGTTISALVEAALRMFLERRKAQPAPLPALPVFSSGGALVDVADRDALLRAMDEDG